MSDPDDDRRPTSADGTHGEPAHDQPRYDHPVGGEEGYEPPVEPGSDESLPADRPAVDFGTPAEGTPAEDTRAFGSDRADGDRTEGDRAENSPGDDVPGSDDPGFGSIEQQGGDDGLAEPGTPPRTIDIDHPDATDTRPNPMADAPAVEESAPSDESGDGDQATRAHDRMPAESGVPPLVEPAPPVEPQRTTPLGTSVPFDEPTPPPATPAEADEPTEDETATTRYPTAAPLPPVTQSEPEDTPAQERAVFPGDTLAPAAAATTVVPGALGREEVYDRQKDAHSGFKFGSAFFGAVVTTGIFVILTALVATVVVAFGLGSSAGVTQQNGDLSVQTIVGAVVVAVILFVAAMSGGYVTGRMARFSGVKQGVATWLWGILFAVVAGLYGWYVGANRADSFMGSTTSGTDMGLGNPLQGSAWWIGVLAIVVVLAVTLLGAIAGGALGMRYHRRVDRAGFEPQA
jgi:membrane protease YdiL (CAAX protease family)